MDSIFWGRKKRQHCFVSIGPYPSARWKPLSCWQAGTGGKRQRSAHLFENTFFPEQDDLYSLLGAKVVIDVMDHRCMVDQIDVSMYKKTP